MITERGAEKIIQEIIGHSKEVAARLNWTERYTREWRVSNMQEITGIHLVGCGWIQVPAASWRQIGRLQENPEDLSERKRPNAKEKTTYAWLVNTRRRGLQRRQRV